MGKSEKEIMKRDDIDFMITYISVLGLITSFCFIVEKLMG
jgi:hypothetical protein